MKTIAMAIALSALTLCSCQTRLGDLTIVSTKNVELSKMGSYTRHPSRVVGEDAESIIIVFPTGSPNIEEACDNAIEQVPGGVALTDAVVTQGMWYIPYIYGRSYFEVEGDVLVDTTR